MRLYDYIIGRRRIKISYKALLFFSLVFLFLWAMFWSDGKQKEFIGISYDLAKLSVLRKELTKKESRGERRCREVLEELFNKPFPNVRPNFLRNPRTGKNLEIDCYNKDLKLGVEYNGEQHYTFIPYFHGSPKAFKAQQFRDVWKKRRCKELGITLIEVPYTVKLHQIKPFLMMKLKPFIDSRI